MWNYSRGQRVPVFWPLIGQYGPILASDWLSLFGAEWGGVSGVFARVSAPPLRNIEHWTHIAVCELQTPNDRGIFAKICIESKSPSAAFIDCLKRNWFLDIFFRGIGRMRKWLTKNRIINLDLVVWCVLRCSQIFSNLDWLTLIPLWQRIFLLSLVHDTPDSSLIGSAVSWDDPWSAVMMTTIPAFKWAQYWVSSRLQRRLKWRFANLDLQNILKLDLVPQFHQPSLASKVLAQFRNERKKKFHLKVTFNQRRAPQKFLKQQYGNLDFLQIINVHFILSCHYQIFLCFRCAMCGGESRVDQAR